MAERVLMSWSTGKDSAMALHSLMSPGSGFEVAALLTTVTEGYDRVSMHGVRLDLLREQADSIGLPLEVVSIPPSPSCSNEVYESAMRRALEPYQSSGVRRCAFGDIFLEDVRRYREEKLSLADMGALFPLWGEDTSALARRFIDGGFRAVLTCVDGGCEALGAGAASLAGREFDGRLLDDLPDGVDPCAENGEFHSFAYDGPIFSRPVAFTLGEVVLRDGRFHFCDLVPSSSSP